MNRLLAMLLALGRRSHTALMPVHVRTGAVKAPKPALHSGERQAGAGKWPFRGKNKAQRARMSAAFGSMM